MNLIQFSKLGGGFKHSFFSPLLLEMFQFELVFQIGLVQPPTRKPFLNPGISFHFGCAEAIGTLLLSRGRWTAGPLGQGTSRSFNFGRFTGAMNFCFNLSNDKNHMAV